MKHETALLKADIQDELAKMEKVTTFTDHTL